MDIRLDRSAELASLQNRARNACGRYLSLMDGITA